MQLQCTDGIYASAVALHRHSVIKWSVYTALFCVACKTRSFHSWIHAAFGPKPNRSTGSRRLLKAGEHHPQSKSDSLHLDAHIPHTHILLLGGALASIQHLTLKNKNFWMKLQNNLLCCPPNIYHWMHNVYQKRLWKAATDYYLNVLYSVSPETTLGTEKEKKPTIYPGQWIFSPSEDLKSPLAKKLCIQAQNWVPSTLPFLLRT